jgi:small-conductance mechanosensitive channel
MEAQDTTPKKERKRTSPLSVMTWPRSEVLRPGTTNMHSLLNGVKSHRDHSRHHKPRPTTPTLKTCHSPTSTSHARDAQYLSQIKHLKHELQNAQRRIDKLIQDKYNLHNKIDELKGLLRCRDDKIENAHSVELLSARLTREFERRSELERTNKMLSSEFQKLTLEINMESDINKFITVKERDEMELVNTFLTEELEDTKYILKERDDELKRLKSLLIHILSNGNPYTIYTGKEDFVDQTESRL